MAHIKKFILHTSCFGIAVLGCAVSCGGDFDTTRVKRTFEDQSTIGQEAYGVLCDRVGASVLQEDLDGVSYRGVCHPDEKGVYADVVNEAVLPPVTGKAALMRNLAIAKLHKFVEHRADFIRAVDTIVPDIEMDNPNAGKTRLDGTIEPEKVHLFDAMSLMIERLNPLYDSNPLVSEGPSAVPLLPAMSQSIARAVDAVVHDPRAHQALASLGGRKGYQPTSMRLGAFRPVLKYPRLRTLYQHSVRLMSPGGRAWEPFAHLLDVLKEQMLSADVEAPVGPFWVHDPDGIAQPNRARQGIELLEHVLLSTDPTFGSASPVFAVLRDSRGMALPAGNTPGLAGTVKAPFVDADGDGFADVDEFGRFVDESEVPLDVDFPFDVLGTDRVRDADASARALLADGTLAYQYVDVTKTLAAAFLKDIGQLADHRQGRETLMYTLSALPVLLGDRKEMVYTFGKGDRNRSISYRGFDPETSPLVHITHALGQLLAHPQSDDFLQMMIDLVDNHPSVVARLAGVLVQLKHIADDYPDLEIPRDSNLWNQISEVLAKVAQVGLRNDDPDAQGLMEDVLLSFANPDSIDLSQLYSKFMKFRDVMSYDPNNINGPPRNMTTGNHDEPRTPVDRSKPAVGDNRSIFFRTMQLIFDSTRTTACNKKDAKIYLKAEALGAVGLNMVYPDDLMFKVLCPQTRKQNLDWCDVYRIDSLTEFYLQSVVESDPKLPETLNKKKAHMIIRDECLASLKWATNMDQAFELSSGITGMSTHPTPSALNRLVHFGADSALYQMTDLDPLRSDESKLNFQVSRFVGQMQEPFGTPVCKKNAKGVDICQSGEDTLRARDFGTLFLWEQFRFREANRPLLYAFYKHDQETLFADLMDIVYFHMEPKDHGSWCSKTGSWDRDAPNFNPRYCAETGLVNFEPMLARMLETQLVAAIHDLAKVGQLQRITSRRYRAAKHPSKLQRRGTEVLATLLRTFVDPSIARENGVKYRDGRKSTVWNDGVTTRSQVTPFDMLLGALVSIDDRFRQAKDYEPDDLAERRQNWTKAGGQLMEQFFAVQTKGSEVSFRNPAIPKAISAILRTVREQLNAHCPNREKGVSCEWAKRGLSDKVAEIISHPLLAAAVDLVDQLRRDSSRDELELFIQYMVAQDSGDDRQFRLLSSLVDMLAMVRDGKIWPPLFNALAHIAKPLDDVTSADSADIIMQVLHILSRDGDERLGTEDPLAFDPYHVFNFVLANITNPIDPQQPSKTALEVLVDVALDINRYDSASNEPMSASDYQVVSQATYSMLTDKTRGLEQIYEVIRGARGY